MKTEAPPPPRRPRGFTLIELVIVLAVTAILGMLALPGMGAGVERQRLQSVAQALAADIAEARFEAARSGLPLHVSASAGADWCWSVSARAGCPCAAADACQLRSVRAAEHPGVALVAPLELRLEPTGAAQAGTAATLQSRRGDSLRVDVSALGRPRVCAVTGHWPRVPRC